MPPRRRWLLVLAGATLVGALVIHFTPKLLSRLDPASQLKALLGMLLVISLSSVGFAVYAFLLGRAVWRAGQWPLAGMRLLHDVPPLTGRRARIPAACLVVLAILLLLVAALLLYLGFYALRYAYRTEVSADVVKLDSPRTAPARCCAAGGLVSYSLSGPCCA